MEFTIFCKAAFGRTAGFLEAEPAGGAVILAGELRVLQFCKLRSGRGGDGKYAKTNPNGAGA